MTTAAEGAVEGLAGGRRRSLAGIVMGLALLLSGCGGAAPAKPTFLVGVVDAERVLADSVPGQKARESLNTFMKNRQALIELEEKELRRLEEELGRQASVLSANAKKEREEQFRRRVVEYQQKANELNREVQEKQKEVFEGFRDQVERVSARVAHQLGLLMVLEKGKGSPTIYSDASLDITPKVIEELNKETR